MNVAQQVTNTAPIVKIVLTLAIWGIILVILPSTPFMQYLEAFTQTEYLNWLNWFIPIHTCVTIMTTWWVAVVAYYGISWIMRQLGVIGL